MNVQLIQDKIYEIRGQKVMIDFDLAEMYEVETRVLNQAIKRNAESFPKDFMFQLTAKEWQTMSSQIVMTYPVKRPKTALPYAFTEHGVTMLASVLKSKKARQMNIAIVRAFIALKHFVLTNKELADKLARLERKYNKQFKDIYEALNYLIKPSTADKEATIKIRDAGKILDINVVDHIIVTSESYFSFMNEGLM